MALSPSLDGYTIKIRENLPYGKTVFHRTGQMMIQMKGRGGSTGVRIHTLTEFVCVCEHVCVGEFETMGCYLVTDYNIQTQAGKLE